MISREYSEAIVEVLEILKYSDYTVTERIPKKLIDFWQKNKSITYKPNLDHNKSINEMNLKDKTKSLIVMLYLNYLCNDEEKKNVKLILINNEKKYQQELREKYNPDNIFKRNSLEVKDKEDSKGMNADNTKIMVYKETFFEKIINIIKKVILIKQLNF